MRKILFAICILISAQSISQDFDWIYTNDVFNKLYNRDNKEFANEINAIKDNSLYDLIYSYNYFWEGLISGEVDETFRRAKQIIQISIENEKDSNLLATLYLMQLRMDLTQKHYLAVLANANNLKTYFSTIAFDTTNCYNQLLWGLYHCIASHSRNAGFIYNRYLAGWPESDNELGLDILLNLTSNKSSFISTEANYFLGKIYLELENESSTAVLYFRELANRYPNNKIYKELLQQALANIEDDLTLQHSQF